jgi:hypothetical protein
VYVIGERYLRGYLIKESKMLSLLREQWLRSTLQKECERLAH